VVAATGANFTLGKRMIQMTREFITTQTFDKEWSKLGLDDEALRLLQNYLLRNPGAGDIVIGTGGLIKALEAH